METAYQLTKKQDFFLKNINTFVKQKITPRVKEIDQAEEFSPEVMRELAGKHLGDSSKVSMFAVREGRAAEEITSHISENGIDLVVMCNRGLDHPSKMLTGDTAENIVRKAGCPVLTIPVSK